MPVYDCGVEDCEECARQFRQGAALQRKLLETFERLDGLLGSYESGSITALSSRDGETAERAAFAAAKALLSAIKDIESAHQDEDASEEREARLEGGHNFMSMQQLGVFPR